MSQRDEDAETAFELLRGGYSPSEDDLREAPVIDEWVAIITDGNPSLYGKVYGHPSIPNGHRTLTSSLLAVHVAGGWARTYSRWYQLGEQRKLDATPAEVEIVNEEATAAEMVVFGGRP
jgi:hypothetical protein